MTHDDTLVERVKTNWRDAGLDPQTTALLEFAERLTSSPRAMSEIEVQALRAAGFSDEEILDTTLIVSLFNFMNRLVEGMGIELEAQYVKPASERLAKSGYLPLIAMLPR